MSAGTTWTEFDLFISYAHADDRGEHARKVPRSSRRSRPITCVRRHAVKGLLRHRGDPHDGRLGASDPRGLRQSKMMVAVLSPAYFASDYCRKEWEIYVETELAQALPGDGIALIYVVTHPAFDGQPTR